jgi:hypothetical protein
MPEDPSKTEISGESQAGFAAPEVPPHSAQSYIGFAPVAEPLAINDAAATDNPLQPASAPSSLPITAQPSVVSPFCRINLREGCYRITYQPKASTSVFHGSMRVERGRKTVISGDLYRFLNPVIGLPATVAAAASVAERPGPATIFQLPLPIPVYPRNKYYSYLKVTNIQLPPPIVADPLTINPSLPGPIGPTNCQFTLTAEEYVYTQPPPGQFNGAFPPPPGSRTVKIVLRNAAAPPGYTSVYFEGFLFQGNVEKGTFKMGWVSPFFRRATVEVDTLQGAVPPAAVPSITGTGTEDFKTVFKTAGWDLNVIFDQTNIPVPAGVNAKDCWTPANLHALMMANRKPGTDLDVNWHFHLIVVPAKLGCSRGVMYDMIDVPREGSASFSDDGYPTSDSSNFGAAANKKQRDVPRAYLRSASHELGHGFNQIHQEQEGGADNSIMTTTPSVADVLAGPTTGQPGVFPDQINLGFNDHVRHHLIHFPDPTVRPGGMTFGSGHSSTVPSADQDRHYFSHEDLSLGVAADQRQIALGEPLLLKWKLTNVSDGPIPVPNNLTTEALYAKVTVVNPLGAVKPMPPFVILCEAASIENLAPGDSVSAETRVYWSSRGFAFERAGRHIIEVDIAWSISGVPFGVRERTDVWVDYPQSQTDNDAAATLMHPEVGMYVALGGGADHLKTATARLDRAFGSSSGGTSDAKDGGTPKAMRGYNGLLNKNGRTADSGGGTARIRGKGGKR